jgi:hypothetical protein
MATPLPFTLYSNAVLEIGEGAFNLASDTYFMILATSAYVPAPDSDATYANVSASEVPTGAGYTLGGLKLSGVSYSLAGATSTFTFSAASWAAFSAALRYGVVIRSANGVNLQATDKLLCFSDLGGGSTITGNGGTFIVSPGGGGVFQATHAP